MPIPACEGVGAPAAPSWDSAQQAVLGDDAAVVRVVAGPGTGKTALAVEIITRAVSEQRLAPHQCLLLAPSRIAAAALRGRLALGCGGTTSGVLARTPESLAFAIVRAGQDLDDGLSLSGPGLITGPEQDTILAELLAGHAQGQGRAPRWPDQLREAAATRGLREELRELLMRAAEFGVTPGHLRRLGQTHGVPAWIAAGDVLAEYEEITALSRPGALDAAGLLSAAATAVEDGVAGAVVDGLRLVVVDDAQELGAAGARLVRALAACGVRLVLLGDPDLCTQSFRGADPGLLLHDGPTSSAVGGVAGRAPVGRGSRTSSLHVLTTSYRASTPLVEMWRRVATQIAAVGGAPQRLTQPRPTPTHRAHPARPLGIAGTAARPAATAASPGATAASSPASSPVALRAATLASVVRGPSGDDLPAAVRVCVLPSQAQQARHIATYLRRARLVDGVPWEQLGVVVRNGGQAATMRRLLLAEGVPVTVPGARVPLRDEPAVRPLLALMRLSLDADGDGADARTITALLGSPIIGLDSLAVRGLRRQLRRAELAAGGCRSSDELLVAAFGAEADEDFDRGALCADASATWAARQSTSTAILPTASMAALQRLGRAVAAGRRAARGGSPDILWAIWNTLAVAGEWRTQARRSGPGAARADRDLDAVCSLFDSAARFEERLPGAGSRAFLDHVDAQEIAADSLVARTGRTGEVVLTTPAGAVGREWHSVVVAGVQEGVWPDLRPRGSILEVPELVDLLDGRARAAGADRIRQVRHEETRLLLVAVSRARENVLVTAVRDEDTAPSAFLDLIDTPATPTAALRPPTDSERPFTLAGIVAELRTRLLSCTDEGERLLLAEQLARLADESVPGADPDTWWSARSVSDDRPRRRADQQVEVSPSQVEAFGDCALRWLLTSSGGRNAHEPESVAVGNLIHEIAATVDNGDDGALQEALERAWPTLGLGQGWPSRRHYQRARTMLTRLAHYHRQATEDGWRVVGRELPADLELGRARLRGRLDRLEADRQGRLRVVDMKTGARKPTRAELARHPQLGAYQLVVTGTGGTSEGLGATSAAMSTSGAEIPDGAAVEATPAPAAATSVAAGAEPASGTSLAAAGTQPGGAPPAGEAVESAAARPARVPVEFAGAALLQLGAAAGARVTLQTQPPLADDSEPHWAADLVATTAEAMGAAHFPARATDGCRHCPVIDSCPLQATGWSR